MQPNFMRGGSDVTGLQLDHQEPAIAITNQIHLAGISLVRRGRLIADDHCKTAPAQLLGQAKFDAAPLFVDLGSTPAYPPQRIDRSGQVVLLRNDPGKLKAEASELVEREC
ncbi:hypothetical protein D9M69_689630 [compost metagenome]